MLISLKKMEINLLGTKGHGTIFYFFFLQIFD